MSLLFIYVLVPTRATMSLRALRGRFAALDVRLYHAARGEAPYRHLALTNIISFLAFTTSPPSRRPSAPSEARGRRRSREETPCTQSSGLSTRASRIRATRAPSHREPPCRSGPRSQDPTRGRTVAAHPEGRNGQVHRPLSLCCPGWVDALSTLRNSVPSIHNM